jgi:hypothetical protein
MEFLSRGLRNLALASCMFYRHRHRHSLLTPCMQTVRDENPSRKPVSKECYSDCMIDSHIYLFTHSTACNSVWIPAKAANIDKNPGRGERPGTLVTNS